MQVTVTFDITDSQLLAISRENGSLDPATESEVIDWIKATVNDDLAIIESVDPLS